MLILFLLSSGIIFVYINKNKNNKDIGIKKDNGNNGNNGNNDKYNDSYIFEKDSENKDLEDIKDIINNNIEKRLDNIENKIKVNDNNNYYRDNRNNYYYDNDTYTRSEDTSSDISSESHGYRE